MARVVNVTQGVIYNSGSALCLCMGCYVHVVDNSDILCTAVRVSIVKVFLLTLIQELNGG